MVRAPQHAGTSSIAFSRPSLKHLGQLGLSARVLISHRGHYKISSQSRGHQLRGNELPIAEW
eukprot:2672977-Pleurochrysis_carterae.AAC.1